MKLTSRARRERRVAWSEFAHLLGVDFTIPGRAGIWRVTSLSQKDDCEPEVWLERTDNRKSCQTCGHPHNPEHQQVMLDQLCRPIEKKKKKK